MYYNKTITMKGLEKMKTNSQTVIELNKIVDQLNTENKERLLSVAIKLLNNEINSFADYQEFVEQ